VGERVIAAQGGPQPADLSPPPRTFFQADCVSEVIHKSGKPNIDIVVCNAPAATENIRYTCCVSDLPILEMGSFVGQMLRDMSLGKSLNSRGRNIPVRLHCVR